MKLRGVLPVVLMATLAAPASAILPQGFSDALVASLTNPTGLAFTPDGRLLIAQQAGIVRVFKDGALLPAPALTIPAAQLCNDFENGLLGMTVDPAFQDNGFVYLYSTFKRPDAVCVNRVSRFAMSGDTLDPASQTVLIDNIPSPNGNHNGGDLKFGKDGYLYVSVGDGGCDWQGGGCQARNDASRDEFVLLGKILRITRDGGIPPGNPFQGQGTARCNVEGRTDPGFRCQETFAWGFRNPFRIAHDPNAAGVRLFINDVGQNTREEIDLAQAGGDYGWNCKEGTRTNSTAPSCQPLPQGLVPPVYEYDHNALVPGTSVSNCGSVTGGAFVPDGLWPGYDGAYLFGDYVCGALFVLRQSGGVWSASDFATGLGADSAVTMIFGPHGHTQALYYTSYSGGGQVRQIFYDVEGNEPPTAVASADPTAGAAPLTVTFDASGSSDPEGDVMTYLWSFGDGSGEEATQLTQIQHTYPANGIYDATLRVRDSAFEVSPPATVQIQVGNTPPVPRIVAPAASDAFRVEQSVTLTGSADDAEDGALPDAALSWVVLLHHNDDHTHPVLGPQAGNGVTFTTPAPEGLAATELSYLEIRLTATDSSGLSRTVSQKFQPNRVQLTLASDPAGLLLVVNDEPVTAPVTVISWEGYPIDLDAPDQRQGEETWRFAAWSDGGAATHAIQTPASSATYTAIFQPPPPDTGVDFHTLEPCRVIDTRVSGQGPALRFKTQRTFAVAGRCGIPSTAKAVAVNVTAVNPLASGHLRVAPSGAAASNTSVVNFRSGVTMANNAFLALSDAGTISVYCFMSSGSTHFLLDVVGYYE